MSKLFAFNLDDELKIRITSAAKTKYTKVGPLINVVLREWLDDYENIVPAPKKKAESTPFVISDEERKERRAWELYMVARGDWHQGWAEEPPRCELSPEETPIYLTPDGKPRNGRLFEGETEIPPCPPMPLSDARNAREKKERDRKALLRKQEETQQEMEDREFEESVKMSLEQKAD